MITRRIIPCLDIKAGRVVNGVKFRDHQVVGDRVALAKQYNDEGADELVFYDITASSDQRVVKHSWIDEVARHIAIPFCVAGGIRHVEEARRVLQAGADKISINSPALESPDLIDQLAGVLGQQCVVVGIDSRWIEGAYRVCQYTGCESTQRITTRKTVDWVREVQARGAGEIVLNCMDCDGVRRGYDIEQLQQVREVTTVPLIASGGAGRIKHFYDLLSNVEVDGALAASLFHHRVVTPNQLKRSLREQGICVRIEEERDD